MHAADLNAIGTHILRSGIVHSLRMRLRTQEWTRRHPEILDEQVAAPIVVVGMMRSGTTLLQRLLAADARFASAPAAGKLWRSRPTYDYRFTGLDIADPRIAISEMREAKSRELARGLFTIHPMYAREAEEEIVFLADAFLSHVPESGAHLPHYRSWLDGQDFTPAYRYLHRMLQFLQWQKRQAFGRSKDQGFGLHRAALGPEVTGAPWLPRSGCVPSFGTCTSCICTATRADDPFRRQPECDPARHARRPRRPRPGGRPVAERIGSTNDRRWRRDGVGATTARVYRHRIRRCGRRSDRTGRPRLRRDRRKAQRRRRIGDAALAGRASS